MQVRIRGVSSDIFVSTVLLSHNKKDPKNLYLFRCYKCGNPISQVQGNITAISAGYIPAQEVPVITACEKCRTKYTFHTQENKVQVVSLILDAETKMNTFHCFICRLPLVQYNHKAVVLLPAFTLINVPTGFTCFGETCQMKYFLRDIVERDVV